MSAAETPLNPEGTLRPGLSVLAADDLSGPVRIVTDLVSAHPQIYRVAWIDELGIKNEAEYGVGDLHPIPPPE